MAAGRLIPPCRRLNAVKSWLVRKSGNALLDRVDFALAYMMEDCTFTQIQRQYIRFSLQSTDFACGNK